MLDDDLWKILQALQVDNVALKADNIALRLDNKELHDYSHNPTLLLPSLLCF
jgi:hypothetical protein